MRKTWVLTCLLLLSAALAWSEDRELGSVLQELDAYLEWNPLLETGVILIANDRVAFKLDFPIALLNYDTRLAIDPPYRKDGAIMFSETTVTTIREAVIKSRVEKKGEGLRVSTIVIDPGHGGKDPGSIGELDLSGKKVDLKEKDVALAVSKHLADLMTANYADRKVLMTRSTDTYVSLEKRSQIANDLLAKTTDSILYVSVHANRAFNTRASGYEVWCLPPEYKRTLLDEKSTDKENLDILPILNSMLEEEVSVESIVLGREILKGLQDKVGKLSPNRGLKEDTWSVVRNSKMPAVLVEVGFVSNPDEGKRLMDDAYLKDVAEGIYNGIRAFITTFEGNGSGTSVLSN